jgi:hypothetical protein
MPVVHNEESDHAKELKKWNTPKRDGGHAPDGFEPYPAMVYQARALNGKPACEDPRDEQFATRCQHVVRDAQEHAHYKADGWSDTPTLALAHAEALAQEIATAAAEANFSAAKMSPKAQAERARLEAATDKHITK